MEWTLQQQASTIATTSGYDRLVHEGAEQVHGHLGADVEYQQRLVRFVENHDERARRRSPSRRPAQPPWRR